MLRATSAPTGASRDPEGSATSHTVVRHFYSALDGHTIKAVAAYQKLAKTVPEKPATSRLFNARPKVPLNLCAIHPRDQAQG